MSVTVFVPPPVMTPERWAIISGEEVLQRHLTAESNAPPMFPAEALLQVFGAMEKNGKRPTHLLMSEKVYVEFFLPPKERLRLGRCDYSLHMLYDGKVLHPPYMNDRTDMIALNVAGNATILACVSAPMSLDVPHANEGAQFRPVGKNGETKTELGEGELTRALAQVAKMQAEVDHWKSLYLKTLCRAERAEEDLREAQAAFAAFTSRMSKLSASGDTTIRGSCFGGGDRIQELVPPNHPPRSNET